MSQMFLFNREPFVWVDETGTDGRDHIRRYGYTLRGLTPVCYISTFGTRKEIQCNHNHV